MCSLYNVVFSCLQMTYVGYNITTINYKEDLLVCLVGKFRDGGKGALELVDSGIQQYHQKPIFFSLFCLLRVDCILTVFFLVVVG